MPDPGRLRRRAVRVAGDLWTGSRLASAGVRAAARRAAATATHDGGHVLVAPPGNGNIGDQAMVEAYLEGTSGPVLVLERTAGDIRVPDRFAARVRVTALPSLVYGTGSARDVDIARFVTLAAAASAVAVVGADMMDGVYSVTGSVRRALTAELAALTGAPTRILGFSWNASARPAALAALAAAVSVGAVAVVRDPVSADRLAAAGLGGIVRASDVVFAATGRDPGAVPEVDRSVPYAVLNVSALVARETPDEEYRAVLERLAAGGRRVVVLPHVLRGSSDDLAAARRVLDVARTEGAVLVDRQLSPSAIRALVADADLVVTGRMHLAILAATVGVPAVTFSTQGKVTGLMALLGTEGLCVEPGPGLGGRTVAVIDEVLASDAVRATLAGRLPAVRDLAALNFDAAGVGTAVP